MEVTTKPCLRGIKSNVGVLAPAAKAAVAMFSRTMAGDIYKRALGHHKVTLGTEMQLLLQVLLREETRGRFVSGNRRGSSLLTQTWIFIAY